MCIHVNSHVRVCAITSLTMTTQLKDETILEHPVELSRVYTGSRRELARVFVSFLLAICPNSSRLTVYTGLRVDLQFLASDYIGNNRFSNMTKTFSAQNAGVNCCSQ